MTFRLFLRAPAKADIRDAFRWYEERSRGLGLEFSRTVRVALSSVERSPQIGAIVIDDVRRARVRRFPFSIYYFINGEKIVVIACMHDRRDPRRWQSRR